MEKDGKNKKYYTTSEAKSRLGVCTKTLHNWEKEGKIETIRGPSNQRYYDLSSLPGGLGHVGSVVICMKN